MINPFIYINVSEKNIRITMTYWKSLKALKYLSKFVGHSFLEFLWVWIIPYFYTAWSAIHPVLCLQSSRVFSLKCQQPPFWRLYTTNFLKRNELLFVDKYACLVGVSKYLNYIIDIWNCVQFQIKFSIQIDVTGICIGLCWYINFI